MAVVATVETPTAAVSDPTALTTTVATAVPLDPWTVYGDITSALTVDVPDIGVLPPPGRYLGVLAGRNASRSVGIVVPVHRPHADGRLGWRRLTIEADAPFLVTIGLTVCLRFEALDLAGRPRPTS